MLSVRTWGKLFAKNPLSQFRPEELENRFWKLENDRTHTYEQTRRQQQHEFSVAVTQWTKGEDTRNDTFQILVKQTQETFARHQAGRDIEFQELIVKHDAIFRSHEDERNAAFSDAGSTRLKSCQVAHEQRKQVIEKSISFTEQLYEQGRTSRRAECQELIKFLREAFSKMIQAMDAAYRTAQDLREKRLILSEKRSGVDKPKVKRPNPKSTGNISPSRSPVDWSPQMMVMPSETNPSSPRPDSRPKPETPRRSHSLDSKFIPRSASPDPDSSPVKTMSSPVTPVTDAPRVNLTQSLDAVFHDRNEHRQTKFLEDQNYRNAAFMRVRAYIEQGGTRRQSQITQLANHLGSIFSETQEHYDRTLAARAKVQDASEAHRDRAFEDAKAHMGIIFEDMLSLMEDQSAALEAMQNQHAQWCHEEIDRLLDGMDDVFQQARASCGVQFLDMIVEHKGQSYALSTPNSPSHTTRSRSPSFPKPTVRRASPGIFPDWLESTRRTAQEQALEVDPFAPQQLFRGNIFSKELPIAPPDTQIEPLSQDNTSHSSRHSRMFHQHFLIFSRAQDKRNIAFVTQMHEFHLEAAALDLQAQLTFKEQQRTFEQDTAAVSLDHERSFRAAQTRRDSSFRSEESNRQDNFQKKQKERSDTFDDEQRSMWQSFEDMHTQLRKGTMQAEAERVMEFLAWRERTEYQIQRKIRGWQKEFAKDEREREKRLDKIVA